MLTLINTNRMTPPIGPLGLEYIVSAAQADGIKTEVLDLCRSENPDAAIEKYFSEHNPSLAGLTFRNVDDCFWPSAKWFVPQLKEAVKKIKSISDSPVVIGGVGYSIFPKQIVEYTGADFGIRGDGEQAVIDLYRQLEGQKRFEKVAGLVWRRDGEIVANKPAWPRKLSLQTSRNLVNNIWYFNNGGQCGIETKRGCNHKCIYCADPLSKGCSLRTRDAVEVVDEIENLLSQGINVLHTCDAEFNIPYKHAFEICMEIVRRNLGGKIRWYTYMSITPFDEPLATIMKKAGCIGIDFTTDSANEFMLKTYRQKYYKEDIETAVKICRQNGITVMLDLLLGGPGETVETAADTINFLKKISPDSIGSSLGVRIYPGTEMEQIVRSEERLETNPNIKRKYEGAVDFFQPTFYISSLLGNRPAELVRDLIAGDKRFFEPMPEADENQISTDHNYNDNNALVEAIKRGARGAYWDILRKIKD